jgi:hypothetical protein
VFPNPCLGNRVSAFRIRFPNSLSYWQKSRPQFSKSTFGDFESLLRRVSLFGSDLGLKFALSIRAKGAPGSVHAFSLKADAANLVTYRIRGVYSRQRQQLSRPEFHALLSVRQH